MGSYDVEGVIIMQYISGIDLLHFFNSIYAMINILSASIIYVLSSSMASWIILLLSSEWFKTLVIILPAIVAAIAIYFAYLHEGKIIVGLNTFCICDKDDKNLYIELPFGFYNTGAIGKTVLGLRIKFKRDGRTSKPFYGESTMTDLGIGPGDDKRKEEKWIKPFVIEPRKGYADIFRFNIKRNIENIKLREGAYKILLEAKLANKKGWQHMDSIDFYIGEETFNCITVQINDPEFYHK